MPTLVLTPRYTDDSQLLWRAASRLGWSVERLSSWRLPAQLQGRRDLVLHAEALFAPALAEQAGLRLIQPAEDWLVQLPYEYRLRDIVLTTLGQARALAEPRFVKPPNDKSFPAAVYTGVQLPQAFDDDMPVLSAEIVSFAAEFRCFVLDRVLKTYSVYSRHGELQRDAGFTSQEDEDKAVEAFVARLLGDSTVMLPRAVVVDVGFIEGRGWACVELNAAWGAGIYACDATLALEVIAQAVEPIDT
jgi:ATP-grasp domain, R2K clade family 2